jgi:hypothetical protein
MKQEFIEKYYLGEEVEIDIGGSTTYRGIASECNDRVLSLNWTIKEEGYTHIEIEKIAAMWKTLKSSRR